MTEHSKLPFHLEKRSPAGVDWDYLLRDKKGDPVASIFAAGYIAAQAEANAAFILNACNCYDDLLTLVKEAQQAFRGVKEHGYDYKIQAAVQLWSDKVNAIAKAGRKK